MRYLKEGIPDLCGSTVALRGICLEIRARVSSETGIQSFSTPESENHQTMRNVL